MGYGLHEPWPLGFYITSVLPICCFKFQKQIPFIKAQGDMDPSTKTTFNFTILVCSKPKKTKNQTLHNQTKRRYLKVTVRRKRQRSQTMYVYLCTREPWPTDPLRDLSLELQRKHSAEFAFHALTTQQMFAQGLAGEKCRRGGGGWRAGGRETVMINHQWGLWGTDNITSLDRSTLGKVRLSISRRQLPLSSRKGTKLGNYG